MDVALLVLFIVSDPLVIACSSEGAIEVQVSSDSPSRPTSVTRISVPSQVPGPMLPEARWQNLTVRDALLLAPGDHSVIASRSRLLAVTFVDGRNEIIPGAMIRDEKFQRQKSISNAVFVFFDAPGPFRRESVVYLGSVEEPRSMVLFHEGISVGGLPYGFKRLLSYRGNMLLRLHWDEGSCQLSVVSTEATPLRNDSFKTVLEPFDALVLVPDDSPGVMVFGETTRAITVNPGDARTGDIVMNYPDPGDVLFFHVPILVVRRGGQWRVSGRPSECDPLHRPDNCVAGAGDVIFYAPWTEKSEIVCGGR